MEKAWFMTPTEYKPHGRGIMAPTKYTLMVNSPNRKGMVLWKVVFKVVIVMVKDKTK